METVSTEKKEFGKVLHSYLPILEWAPKYNGKIAVNDLVVALIGTIMDGLNKTRFKKALTGKIFNAHYEAITSINPDLALKTLQVSK
jgi:hypothetical protein